MRYDSTRIVLLTRLMLVARTLLACGPSVMKRPPAAISHIAGDTLHEIPSRIGSVGFRNRVTSSWNPNAGARASTHLAIQQADILNAALTDERREICAYFLRTAAEGAKAHRPILIRWVSDNPYDPPTGELRSVSLKDGPFHMDDGAAALRSQNKSPELSQAPLPADQQTIAENLFRAGLVAAIPVVVMLVIGNYMRRMRQTWRLDTEKWAQHTGLS